MKPESKFWQKIKKIEGETQNMRNNLNAVHGAMQEIDQVGMAKPITKGSWMITDPKRIPDMIGHAIRVAYSGRRGPVHLTIPVDVQQMEVGSYDEYEFVSETSSIQNPISATNSQISNIIDLMKTAQKPLIILGSAASYSNSTDSIRELIETIKFPVILIRSHLRYP